MRRIVYAASFRGSAAPANEAGTKLKAETRTDALLSLDGDLPAGLGPGGRFQSTVHVGEAGSFGEDGTIDFGGGNTIAFSQVVNGTMAPASDGVTGGAIDWKVDSGTGIFAGASGYITSNFTVSESGEVVDHQLASIVLP